MMDRHIEQVEARIQELTKLNEQLRTLRRSCSNRRTVEQCGILRNLSATRFRAVTPGSKTLPNVLQQGYFSAAF